MLITFLCVSYISGLITLLYKYIKVSKLQKRGESCGILGIYIPKWSACLKPKLFCYLPSFLEGSTWWFLPDSCLWPALSLDIVFKGVNQWMDNVFLSCSTFQMNKWTFKNHFISRKSSWEQASDTGIQWLSGTSTSDIGLLGLSYGCSACNPASCKCAFWRNNRQFYSTIWVLATHMGNLKWVPESLPQLHYALTVGGHLSSQLLEEGAV